MLAFDDNTSPGFNDGGWVSQVGLEPFPFNIVFNARELEPPPGRVRHSDKPQGSKNLVVLNKPGTIMVIDVNGRMNVFP